MLEPGARFRRRLTINPIKAGNQKVGDLFLKINDQWVPHPWGSSMVAYNNTPYLKVESCKDEIHAGPPYRSGGPFTKIKIEHPPFKVIGNGAWDSQGALWPSGVGSFPVKYVGGFTNPEFVGDSISDGQYANLELLLATNFLLPDISSWGSQAWSKTAPNLEKGGAAVALAEARDIPRMLSTSAGTFHDIWRSFGGSGKGWKQAPKKASDHFLNHQFGWIPFLSDISKFADIFENAHIYNSRITRENGKWVRRKAILRNAEPAYRKIDGNIGQRCEPKGGIFSVPTMFNEQPTWECGEETSTYITASGLFKYYRPEFDFDSPDYHSAWSLAMRQMTLYGARVSPSNIYKATPWSWAIDWFTNFGDIVDRANDWAYDSIVAKYLYLMHHTVRRMVLTQTLPFKSGNVVLQWRRIIDIKRRAEASSSYGFDLSPNSLTGRQIAILAALGISRT